MGYLLQGKWVEGDFSTVAKDVIPSQFKGKLTRDGSSGFPPTPGRYCVYISHACPFAHRVAITLVLKRLQTSIPIIISNPVMSSEGWRFGDGYPGSTSDFINGFTHLHQAYTASIPDFTGKVTVPTLWDTLTKQVVSNESAEIIEMINEAFDEPGSPDLYPRELRSEVDSVNKEIYEKINTGVYKVGMTKNQEEYETNVKALFRCLDWVEERLNTRRYLVGETFTVADIRLFTTLVRFDPVYFVLFKCCLRPISSYANIINYLRDICQLPGVASTLDMSHIMPGYFCGLVSLNPYGIVPIGPVQDLTLPHNRHRLPGGLLIRNKQQNDSLGYFSTLAEAVFSYLLIALDH